MNKLKTGYYAYDKHHGITYLATIVEIRDFRRDTVLVTPSNFHESVTMYDFSETLIAYFLEDNALLIDLNDTHTIGNLYDY